MQLRTATMLGALILPPSVSARPAPPPVAQTPSAHGTSRVWGTVEDIAFEGAVECPPNRGRTSRRIGLSDT
jgi:hypothetical protein